MQKFVEIKGQDRVKDSREVINENFESVASNFSGDNFPTENVQVGMKCYRTDTKQTYTLESLDPATWVEDTPERLRTPRNISISGKVTGTATAFDGTQDISIKATAVTADSCTGNSETANTAYAVNGTVASRDNTGRHIWISDSSVENKRAYDNSFLYNTTSQTLTVAKVDGNAATATRLQNARTISLSGNATGSVTFDGTANVTLDTAVNWATSAGSANTASRLATSRRIYLAGNATGSAVFDGSSDISIQTSVTMASTALNIPVGDNGGNIWIQP